MDGDTIIYYYQVVRYMHVASTVILLFDYALTFGLEVSLIWRSKWSLTKVLFILSRYSTVFDVPLVLYYSITPYIPTKRCSQLHEGITWVIVFGISVAEAILIMRTYALSGCKRGVLIIFVSLWVVRWCICIDSTGGLVFCPECNLYVLPAEKTFSWRSHSPQTNLHRFPEFQAVILPQRTEWMWRYHSYWFLSTILARIILLATTGSERFFSVIMAYTLWLGIKKYGHLRSPLVVTLYRDGITYYVFLFVVSLLNVLILESPVLPKKSLGQLDTHVFFFLLMFLRVMHSVLSTRIILHIRKVERENFTSIHALDSESEVQFHGQS
ncbi:hypothetical protein MVEN_01943900 [Mycena venus]|uniref:DUF6533 domain-containing protein n=1 Tax=Mycena venus TaxID=2733690 RepID=A0A8H6XGU2_9AGAR|nr:hypothetical protein MVEN_01943900 [Mycena venus]